MRYRQQMSMLRVSSSLYWLNLAHIFIVFVVSAFSPSFLTFHIKLTQFWKADVEKDATLISIKGDPIFEPAANPYQVADIVEISASAFSSHLAFLFMLKLPFCYAQTNRQWRRWRQILTLFQPSA